MSKTVADRAARVRVGVACCAAAAAVAAVVALLTVPDQPASAGAYVRSTHPMPDPDFIPVHAPALDVPDALPPADVEPGEAVIGVAVNGKHRAYTLGSLQGVTTHVVNDRLGGRPVSVSYCVRTGCVRVYTAAGGERLRLAVGGLLERKGAEQMILRYGRELYRQDTGAALSGGAALPYQTLDFKLTTWDEWQKAHPDSDVYSGGPTTGY